MKPTTASGRELFLPGKVVRSARRAAAAATGARMRGAAVALAGALLLQAATASAGPVLVYREGEACPRGRPADAPRITAAQAVERAKELLPKDFCGPSWWVSGCEFDPEWAYDTWRVFAQQYVLDNGVRDIRGRDHSYVVLDAVGNCIANIPGT